MTRSEALTTAAGVIARHTPDLPPLVDLLQIAGLTRLAARLRGSSRARPVEIKGGARPDIEMWRKGRL
jgi:hypothetical protein